MSLNKFMHPRNRYKNSKPSFLHLALKYPQFRAHTTQDDKGKVFIDFKNADALRVLSTCLLKEDFGLSVDLPADRLVPTVPLRLNYIHWLEDIVGTSESLWGIDIGTGASCVYPLLAAKMNKWHFLATEADTENAFHANKNVKENGLQDFIHVKQVTPEDVLMAPLQSFTANNKFDFCMCNPPFFADHMEAQALTTTRSADRPDANSLSTASPQECIAQGGEVGFIRQMIEESTVLRDRIRVYSSMVGKKSSLTQLKAELLHQKVVKFSTTEFCQGKTMRWGIAWTYDSSVTFPRSEFESRKEKPPLQYMVPRGAGGVAYKVHELASYLKQLLESIKVHCYQGKIAKSYTSVTLTASENTWCHQRRLRRQQHKKHQEKTTTSEVIVRDLELGGSTEPGGVALAKSNETDKHSDKSGDATAGECTGDFREMKSSTSSGGSRKRLPEQSVGDTGEAAKRRREESNNNGEKTEERNNLSQNEGTSENDALARSGLSQTEGRIDDDRITNSILSQTENKTESGITSESGSSQTNGGVKDSAKSNCNSKQIVENCHLSTSGISVGENSISNTDTNLPSSSGLINEGVASASKEEDNTTVLTDSSPKEYILKCVMRLKRVNEQVQLELEWLDGQSRELMHQVMTFLQNKLAQNRR